MATVDNQILAMSKCLQETSEEKVILVTKDINVRVKCDALGIKCEDFNKHRIVDKQEGLYAGVKRASISQAVIDKIYSQGYADLEDIPVDDVYPNEFLVLKDENSGQGSAIVRYMGKENKFRLK